MGHEADAAYTGSGSATQISLLKGIFANTAAPADETTFTYGTSLFAPIGGTYNSSITALSSGQAGAVALTNNRSMHVLDDNSSALLTAAQAGTTTTGSAVPSSAIYLGYNVSGNLTGATGTSNGLKVDGTSGTFPVTGTVTSQWSSNNAAATPHFCSSHIFKHITSATDTQAVAASGSTTIYVCDYSFSFGGAGNFYLEKATSGTCATLTQLTGQWYGAANSGKVAAENWYRGVNTGASAQLCINTSTFTGPLDIDIYYDQY
jgi:hypothetical protein